MPVKPFLFFLLTLLSLRQLACAAAEEVQYTNHSAAAYGDLLECVSAMQSFRAGPPNAAKPIDPHSPLTVLSWNVQKGENEGWLTDLRQLARGKQLVLLQEALLTETMYSPLSQKVFWSFAPGYRTDDYRSGLMMLSQIAPAVVCRFQVFEPWLRSPKATGVALLPVAGATKTLLVINVHAVNFSIGLDEFERQLNLVRTLLAAIEGPAVVAGDFNTWRTGRQELMETFMSGQGMKPVSFRPDKRVTVLGFPLDHVWVRDLTPVSARACPVSTSDHNPLILQLIFPEELSDGR